jgi:hypothetical protein
MSVGTLINSAAPHAIDLGDKPGFDSTLCRGATRAKVNTRRTAISWNRHRICRGDAPNR